MAARVLENGRAGLLISGTASVIGHATAHSGDALAQTDEAASNLDALLGHAAARLGKRGLVVLISDLYCDPGELGVPADQVGAVEGPGDGRPEGVPQQGEVFLRPERPALEEVVDPPQGRRRPGV